MEPAFAQRRHIMVTVAPFGWSWAGTTLMSVRERWLSSVWEVRTEPSSEAFLPTVMVVHSSLNWMSVCAGRVPKAKMYAAASSSSRMLFVFQFRFFPVLVYEVLLSVLHHAGKIGFLRIEKADFVVHRLDHLNALGVDESVFPIFGH